jgi:hypothetical protein
VGSALGVFCNTEAGNFADGRERREAVAVDEDVINDRDADNLAAGYKSSGSADIFI